MIVQHLQSSDRILKQTKSEHITKRKAFGAKSELNKYEQTTNLYRQQTGADTQSMLDHRKSSVNSDNINFNKKTGNVFYQHNFG